MDKEDSTYLLIDR